MISITEKRKIILDHFQESIDLYNKVSKSSFNDIEKAVDLSFECLKSSGTIFWCGNGGSASDAQHLAAELVCRYVNDRKPLKSIALNTDTSVLTAISNDYSYENIFSRQLEALAKSGDLLFVISTSGNSKNILNVVQKAKDLKSFKLSWVWEKHTYSQAFNQIVQS